MSALPDKSEIYGTYPNPSNAVAREGFGKLWDYLAGLFGQDGTAATARKSLGLGSPGALGGRNRALNGWFPINQRAVSGTVTLAAGAYGHDCWKAGAGGCTYTFAKVGITTTITISAGTLVHVIDGVNIEGGVYCMSWTGTAQGKIAGGSLGASGIVSSSQAAGANVTIEFATGTLTNVQVEPGDTATAFTRREETIERALCLARFKKGIRQSFSGYQSVGASVGGVFAVFGPPMRAAPTPINVAVVSAINVTGPTFSAIGTTQASLFGSATATGPYLMDLTIDFNAEL